MPNPNEYESEDDFMKVCVPKMIGEGKDQDQAVAACMGMWKEKGKASEQSLPQSDFSFTELSGDQTDFKYIDGLSAGSFTAMTGDKVTFKPEELEEYVSNTQKVIESTRTDKGEIVGLPIDKDAHDHKGGAGWIVGAELDKTRNVIRFLVNWTQEGLDLIKSNARRYFSPSAIPSNKTILGGSLTNWPATRTKLGEHLLRPIELSQHIKEIDMTKTLNEIMQDMETANTQIAALTAQVAGLTAAKPSGSKGDKDITPEMKDFIANTPGAAELGQEAQEIAMRVINDEKRKNEVRDFAAKIVGGTKDKPFGVPVSSNAIVAALLALPDDKRKFMQDLIEHMWLGAIDFAERGYNSLGDLSAGKRVPEEWKPLIKEWMSEDGKTAASWIKEVQELDARDYNLKEFEALEKQEA